MSSCPVCGGDCSSANPPVIGCPNMADPNALREAFDTDPQTEQVEYYRVRIETLENQLQHQRGLVQAVMRRAQDAEKQVADMMLERHRAVTRLHAERHSVDNALSILKDLYKNHP